VGWLPEGHFDAVKRLPEAAFVKFGLPNLVPFKQRHK
jgi:hypothetical protein